MLTSVTASIWRWMELIDLHDLSDLLVYATFYIHAKWGKGLQVSCKHKMPHLNFREYPFISPPAALTSPNRLIFQYSGKMQAKYFCVQSWKKRPVSIIFQAGIPIFSFHETISPVFFSQSLESSDETVWGITSFNIENTL